MKKRINKRWLWTAFAATALASIALLSVSIAKYVTNRNSSNNAVEAGRFVFVSDRTNGETYYTNEETFEFCVQNYETEGYGTPFDIQYTVSGFSGTYTLNGNKIGSKETFKLTDLQVNIPVTVTIKSVSPYEKTIIFTVCRTNEVVPNKYSVTDNGSWVQVDIYIGSTVPDGGIQVQYGYLSPDTLNTLMKTWEVGTAPNSAQTLGTLSPYSHYTLLFFENTTGSQKSYKNINKKDIDSSNTVLIEVSS